jgi:hypothetical protein
VAICYGLVVCISTLSHLLSESCGLLVQTLNVSRGLHVQTLRVWVLTAQCYVSGAVSNLLLLSAILLVIYCRQAALDPLPTAEGPMLNLPLAGRHV